MRTTLTLEPDVAAMLTDYRQSRRLGLKEAVNEVLRRGLAASGPEPSEGVAFATREVDHGRPLVAGLDDIGEALVRLDEEASAGR